MYKLGSDSTNYNLKIPSFPEYIIWIVYHELNLSLDIYILYEIFYHIAKAKRKVIKPKQFHKRKAWVNVTSAILNF